MTVAVSTVCTT